MFYQTIEEKTYIDPLTQLEMIEHIPHYWSLNQTTNMRYELFYDDQENNYYIVDTSLGIVFDSLEEGTYILSELEAPEGYLDLLKDISITITKDSNEEIYLVETDIGPQFRSLWQSGVDAELTVYNYTRFIPYELPSSGGPGTYLFTIFGTMCIVLAGILLLSSFQKDGLLIFPSSPYIEYGYPIALLLLKFV